MTNKQEQITFCKYVTMTPHRFCVTLCVECPLVELSCYRLKWHREKKQKAKEHVLHRGRPGKDILTYIMDRRMFKTKCYKSSTLLWCVCDVSVCYGLNDIHYNDVQFSTGLAGARSCGWIQWWKCFRLLERLLSLAELPRGLCPSPKSRNILVKLGSSVCRLCGWFGERLFRMSSILAPKPLGVFTYRHNLFFTGVDDADLLVLASGAE